MASKYANWGAARYAHPAYEDGIALECAAMKRVREVMGLDNVKLMIPFCRRLRMLALAIEGAKRNGHHSGICGQAPSDYPEVEEYLVRLGIDSLSPNPDSVLPTTRAVLEFEAATLADAKEG